MFSPRLPKKFESWVLVGTANNSPTRWLGAPLVHQILQVGTTKASSALGDLRQGDAFFQLLVALEPRLC